jgi:membrane protease YdiL (CAAX protease family)
MHSFVKTIITVRWQPSQDTVVALLTALLMIPVFYVGTHDTTGIVGLLVFVILGNGILNVLFPAYYLLVVRKERPQELGITTDRLWLAVGLSLVWGLMSWVGLQKEARLHPEADLLPQLVFNGLILWEPFFVYGWLQLRFERAFGMLPGIVLAAACFGAYHLGTYPLPAVGMLVVIGLIYAILFRMTKNLLTLWPLVWSVGSSIGTLQGGFYFGWDQVGMYAIILLVQIVAIAWMISHGRKRGTAGEMPC